MLECGGIWWRCKVQWSSTLCLKLCRARESSQFQFNSSTASGSTWFKACEMRHLMTVKRSMIISDCVWSAEQNSFIAISRKEVYAVWQWPESKGSCSSPFPLASVPAFSFAQTIDFGTVAEPGFVRPSGCAFENRRFLFWGRYSNRLFIILKNKI